MMGYKRYVQKAERGAALGWPARGGAWPTILLLPAGARVEEAPSGIADTYRICQKHKLDSPKWEFCYE